MNTNAYLAQRRPSTGLAPPVAAAPPAASGLASRRPLRREFGDKLAKVFP
ncbi:hypothetical protein SAV14893_077010 [Streptomyces avermitilis]|uniref:Uncharacterized protein n=1 Tax=Streptomyces avermitilis TaxID=33903 RepID=A0A4D4MH53_STRAX|nr:hypothetical protein SAV14893_077010 [Streptomyces avermitilis]GDY71330.1 hypothetical protein SAV31267_008150 [Streptomyces avermitilis]